MKKMNRVLSIFLVLTMLFAVSVVKVSATETIQAWNDANDDGVIDENETTYTDFAEAAESGGEFKLNSDIVLSKDISLYDGVKLVVDLNGHSITTDDESMLNAFYLDDYVQLTIKDSVGTGSIGGENIRYTIWIVGANAVFTLEGGSITGSSSSFYFNEPTATVNINGGSISTAYFDYGTLNIRGGTVTKCVNNRATIYYYGGDVVEWEVRFGSLNFDPTPYLNSGSSKLAEYDSSTGLYTVYYNALSYTSPSVTGSYVYNGTPQIPTLDIRHNHLGTLRNGVDYTVTATDNINAGTATATITYIMEEFRGSETIAFTINPKDITVKADNQSVMQGNTLDSTALTVTGLVDGHNATATFVNDTTNFGTSELVIDVVTITDADGNDVTSNYNITTENGILDVMVAAALHGNVISFGDETEEVTIEIFAENSEEAVETITLTGNNTNYFVEELEKGNYTIRVSKLNHVTREYEVVIGDTGVTQNIQIHLIGDVNGDGKVMLTDYTAILKHVKKTALLEDYALACADVDGNGKVMITDYSAVLRHVKKTESLW